MLTSIEFLVNYFRSRFGNDERGASLVNYALFLVLFAIAIILAVVFLPANANSCK